MALSRGDSLPDLFRREVELGDRRFRPIPESSRSHLALRATRQKVANDRGAVGLACLAAHQAFELFWRKVFCRSCHFPL